ncbi:hypothetical protein [Tumebacillus lipolyticus]|uniref:Uncharacterized protein n=1 Tax=Tumebacillus lipolyticus TaxID=1280370 RepID=A0ABW4ZXI4_9BACL
MLNQKNTAPRGSVQPGYEPHEITYSGSAEAVSCLTPIRAENLAIISKHLLFSMDIGGGRRTEPTFRMGECVTIRIFAGKLPLTHHPNVAAAVRRSSKRLENLIMKMSVVPELEVDRKEFGNCRGVLQKKSEPDGRGEKNSEDRIESFVGEICGRKGAELTLLRVR